MDAGTPCRSLVLTGGVQDAAFQAGVLQVWLDEVGLVFDHVDASGGSCLDAAMWAEGTEGTAMADRWRAMDPSALDFAWASSVDPLRASSLFTLERWRRVAFSSWGLDWGAIRESERTATFRVWDRARGEPVLLEPSDLDEDVLHGAISSPGWLPAVPAGERIWADASFVVGGTLDEALGRGADEIWIVAPAHAAGSPGGILSSWTRMGEMARAGRVRDSVARVERSNAAIEGGRPSELDRHVEVKLLEIDSGFGFPGAIDRDRIAETVNRGVEAARSWCLDNDVSVSRVGRTYPTEISEERATIRFREVLRGRLPVSENGKPQGDETEIECHLRVLVAGGTPPGKGEDVVGEVSGAIVSEDLGGSRRILDGAVTFHDGERGPGVVYRLRFEDREGRNLVLLGVRPIGKPREMDLLAQVDVDVRLLDGDVLAGEGRDAAVIARGALVVHPLDRLRQIVTLRATGPSREVREEALDGVGGYLYGTAWDACVADLRGETRGADEARSPEDAVPR